MVKAGGNRAPNLSRKEKKDFDEISGHEFPWTLVLNRENLDKFWPSVVLFVVDPLVATSIDLEFQIDEPSWAGFTFYDFFMPLIP